MIDLLPIRTSRLELRRFSPDDLFAFQAYRRDPELSRYQGWEPTSDEQASAFLAQQSNQAFGPAGQWLQVAVTCIDSGQLVGDLGMCIADPGQGIANLGFTISRPFQQQGYAIEAVRGILSRLFDDNLIQSVVAVTDARNAPAISLLQRLEFNLADSNDAIFRGEACIEHTFEVTKTQWGVQQACPQKDAPDSRNWAF